ncbi:MAG TPA: FtsW/RodA/SpoVE family cell cycle protein, partial [Candidatus Paceibacterota bacterium]
LTFFNPSQDLQGTGYQARQSLIAIGSGEWVGRGFGQSVQKFKYLPEPIGDSIFAVFSEEFGLVGSIMLILFFIFFFLQSLRIATHTSDSFAMLTVLGISILIVVESFMNISSMLGLIPIFGMPLLFVSHGGTALIVTLGAVGIIANISKYKKS